MIAARRYITTNNRYVKFYTHTLGWYIRQKYITNLTTSLLYDVISPLNTYTSIRINLLLLETRLSGVTTSKVIQGIYIEVMER